MAQNKMIVDTHGHTHHHLENLEKYFVFFIFSHT